MESLALGQTGPDKQGQAPQAVSLSRSPPEGDAALKFQLEFTLKLLLKGWVLLGGEQ